MPDPSPALIDTIARALASIDGYGPDLWDDTQSPHEYWYGEVRGKYRDQTRAALAALPQPIAHGILMHRYAPEAAWVLGPYDRTEAERLAAREPDLGLGTSTVVALVPVEDQ